MINIRISHDSIMSKVSMMIIGYGDNYDNYRHNPTPRIDLFVAPSVRHEIPSASWIYASCIQTCMRIKDHASCMHPNGQNIHSFCLHH